MTYQEAHELRLAGGAVIVDVREREELEASGLAEGALWMPSSRIAEEPEDWEAFRQGLPQDKIIFIYCKTGGRSGRVAELLLALGFRAENLGAFCEWAAAGLPVLPFSQYRS